MNSTSAATSTFGTFEINKINYLDEISLKDGYYLFIATERFKIVNKELGKSYTVRSIKQAESLFHCGEEVWKAFIDNKLLMTVVVTNKVIEKILISDSLATRLQLDRDEEFIFCENNIYSRIKNPSTITVATQKEYQQIVQKHFLLLSNYNANKKNSCCIL